MPTKKTLHYQLLMIETSSLSSGPLRQRYVITSKLYTAEEADKMRGVIKLVLPGIVLPEISPMVF